MDSHANMNHDDSKPRRNNKQLRLSKQNEIISERLKPQWELENARNVTWMWFGNYLMSLGAQTCKKQLFSRLTHKESMMKMADNIKPKKGLSDG